MGECGGIVGNEPLTFEKKYNLMTGWISTCLDILKICLYLLGFIAFLRKSLEN